VDASLANLWTVPRAWDGEACFVVCGGESVRDLDLSRLAGRRVIAINDSAYSVPDADFLVFSDKRWWGAHRQRVLAEFRGQVVTVTPMLPSPDYLLLGRARMGSLTTDPRHLAVWHTTVCPAVNLAAHLGAGVVNFLGLDGRGGWHHAPHQWKQNQNKFYFHGLALEALVEPLRALGIAAHNACKDSTHRMFPHRSYEDMLA
jgi:hypothetical protein